MTVIFIAAAIIVLIHVLFIFHVIKNKQPRYWLWAIIALPCIGCAIYLLEMRRPNLFSLSNNRDGKNLNARSYTKDEDDPECHVRKLYNALLANETSENHLHLADELARIGRAKEAAANYQQALSGAAVNDTDIMLKLAHAQFACRDMANCQHTLETLHQIKPHNLSQDAHLLYARVLHKNGDLHKAIEEYRALVEYYIGPEARYRFYKMLREHGDCKGAKHQLKTIAAVISSANAHYQELHKEWLIKINQEMKRYE
ncbi:MAG: hypothetical protein LBN41_11355 [Enterobacteriaceae bacterium]|jgi:hypothetical protein|nr:hypothetical protein [Enterobacteriaceae bacterium]